MQAVILAAGRGTRMGSLTNETPKSMLNIAGKSILEWKLESLPDVVDEVVIVTGYLGDVIRNTIGNTRGGRKITYVTQSNPVGGTMDALLSARTALHGTFLVMNGDDIHTKEDLERCVQSKWTLAVSETDDLRSSALVLKDAAGEIVDIIEADQHGGGKGLAGVGAYLMDTRVFEVEPVPIKGGTEIGLPQTMLRASRTFNIPIVAPSVAFPLHFTTPDDIHRAEQLLSGKK